MSGFGNDETKISYLKKQIESEQINEILGGYSTNIHMVERKSNGGEK